MRTQKAYTAAALTFSKKGEIKWSRNNTGRNIDQEFHKS